MSTVELHIPRLSRLLKHWFPRFSHGFGFPRNYSCLDIETSGTDPQEHLICSISWLPVRDHQPQELYIAYLNWTAEPLVNKAALADDLERLAWRTPGEHLEHCYANLHLFGRPPRTVLQECLAFCQRLVERSEILVTHNGWFFDCCFLEIAFQRWLQETWQFPEDLVFDTGVCEKAHQLDDNLEPFPRDTESMLAYAQRVHNIFAPGVFWNLRYHCAEKYNLWDKAQLTADAPHAADTDVRLLHALFEEYCHVANSSD